MKYASLAAFALVIAGPAIAQDVAPIEQPSTGASEEGPAPSALSLFLRAADAADTEAMLAQLAPEHSWMASRVSAPRFLERLNNCYLRRVYRNENANSIIAAWMCEESRNRSRVVLADLAMDAEGKVVASVVREDRNDIPAPARQGSAFD